MSAATPLSLLFGTCLVTCVTADNGDDFSNNLLSDLGPLLALFGERVTMQFMSQSTGWADNIILAMAPLGIITIIVSAIRAGGPSWLKAVIGRARESFAVTESELLSSTSQEVCELWNGQQIVRVMGTGPIREFIILLPKGGSVELARDAAPSPALSAPEHAPVNGSSDDMDLSQRIEVLALKNAKKHMAEYRPTLRQRISGDLIHLSDPEKALAGAKTHKASDSPGAERSDGSKPSVVIIRNTEAHAPNLSLNVNNQPGRGELYAVAAFGVILQLAVIVYSGLATYHLMLLKDEALPAAYAFPCTAAGMFCLAIGMLVCSHVVESSTSETRYRPADGMEAHVVWLQKSATVNDQAFEPFAVFPCKPQPIVTVSYRASAREQERRTMASTLSDFLRYILGLNLLKLDARIVEARIENFVAASGAAISMCGFLTQFIGLRGMHWSVSIAQLGATIIMTLLRTWVRRNLAEKPKAVPLVSGHELDWLAMTLRGNHTKAPWFGALEDLEVWDKHKRAWADDDDWDWKIATVDNPERCGGLCFYGRSITFTPVHPRLEILGNAHRLMRFRRELGELADWRGPASAEAISLACAIEVTMYALPVFKYARDGDKCTWSITAHGPAGSSDRESIAFRVEWQDGRWKAFSDEIEAALSLWLYSVDKQENHTLVVKKNDDGWLRVKGTVARTSLRLLGSYTAALYRDLRWWMPDGAIGVMAINDPDAGEDPKSEAEAHRVVGFASDETVDNFRQYTATTPAYPRKGTCLGVETNIPLKRLYAQHMFSAFMFAVAETAEVEVKEKANVRRAQRDDDTDEDSSWQNIALHNAQLAKLAQDIQATGLGSLEEVYLSIIPPLSIRNKLPRADAVVEWTQEHTRPHEQLGHWKGAADGYLWLLKTARTFPQTDGVRIKASALMMELLRAMDIALKVMDAQQYPTEDVDETQKLHSKLVRRLHRYCLPDVLERLLGLYQHQGRWWNCGVRAMTRLNLGDKSLKLSYLHMMVLHRPSNVDFMRELYWYADEDGSGWASDDASDYENSADEDDEEDDGEEDTESESLESKHIKFGDIEKEGHVGENNGTYDETDEMDKGTANQTDDESDDKTNDGTNDEVGDDDDDDWITEESNKVVEHQVDAAGQLGSKSSDQKDAGKEWFNTIRQSMAAQRSRAQREQDPLLDTISKAINKGLVRTSQRDIFDWTPLHYAAARRSGDMVNELLSNIHRPNVNARDIREQTPLHYACRNPDAKIVYALLRAGADVNARGIDGLAPVHCAAIFECRPVVQLLIEAGADSDAMDGFGNTALLWAAFRGCKDIVADLWNVSNSRLRNHLSRTPLHMAVISRASQSRKRAVVEFLVGKGVDIRVKDRQGATPLRLAFQSDHEAVVDFLLQQNAGKAKNWMLRDAVLKGHAPLVKVLFKHGAKVDARWTHGLAPLHLAAWYGHKAVVKALFDAGADVGAQNKNEATPMHFAAQRGSKRVIVFLLRRGAEINARNKNGSTPLHFAVQNGFRTATRLLINRGAEVGARDDTGRIPLHYAAQYGHEAIAKLLMDAGAKADAADEDAQTPLHLAAKNGNEGVVKLIIGSGVDVAARDVDGWTPLHFAAYKGHQDMAAILVGCGANTEAVAEDGSTPLHVAAESGREALAKFLIDNHGANIEAQDEDGRRPLHIAAVGGRESVMDLLVARGADINARDSEGWTAASWARLFVKTDPAVDYPERRRKLAWWQKKLHVH